MENHSWVQAFSGSITVCDPDGIILEMNDKAMETFKDQGGTKLIGTNLFDCHPEHARSKLKGLMETQKANVYTVEKNGNTKFIYQTPWYRGEKYCGFVELSLEIPAQMPHFVRNK
ncbi:MAG: PAS domain-containing protein [Desulfobacteraceae bacterium]|jgi:transcriptional regulator with PAS, ATPase and Fis domain